MPGNFLPTVEVNPPPRPFDRRNEVFDHRLPLRHFSSVDNFVRPSTPPKMPRKTSFVRSKPRQMTVSPEEFNSLPASIQMKYFSPEERLQIAKEAARQARKKQPTAGSSLHLRPSTESARRPKTGLQSSTACAIDAQRRPQSAHARCASAVSSTVSRPSTEASFSDPRTHLRSCRKNRVDSTGRQSTNSQAIIDEETGKTWLDTDSVSIHSVESTGTVEGIFKLYGHKQQTPAAAMSNVLSLRPQPFPAPPSSSVLRFPPCPRRRAMKLTPLRLPPPTLLPAVPALPSPTTLRHMAKSIRSNSNTSVFSTPPSSSRDEDHIRTPEKFDEAVHFGYTSDRPDGRTASPLSNAGTFDSAQLTPYADGEREDDDDDTDDVSSAVTPSAPSITSNDRDLLGLHHHSADSDFAVPIFSKIPLSKASIRSLSSDTSSQDSTTRTVSGKPEPRAPEQQLYSYQRKQVSGVDLDNSGALMLQELYICDDHSGAQGAFAVYPSAKNGGLRKVWKNITRR